MKTMDGFWQFQSSLYEGKFLKIDEYFSYGDINVSLEEFDLKMDTNDFIKKSQWIVDPEPEGIPFALGWDQQYHQNGFKKPSGEGPSCFKRNDKWWNGYPKPQLYSNPDYFDK